MQEIRKAIPFIKEVIGIQKWRDNTQYRLLAYTIQQKVENGVLLYNVLTRSLLLLTKEELENLLHQHQLVEQWFLVPQDFDDHKFCNQVRLLDKMLAKPKKGIQNYTILTTTDCNARCFYCYEAGRPRVPMTEKMAHEVAHYIVHHKEEYEIVRLHWFGGEPLHNFSVINIICHDLEESGIKYESTMTSNGYLFTDELVNKAINLWKLQSIQITLDGTEHKYNKIKAYIDCNDNAYWRVMSNIKKLIEKSIYVTIRLNIDFHNIDDMEQLVAELANYIGKTKYLKVYSHPLFENTGLHPQKRSLEELTRLIHCQQKLEKFIATKEINRKKGLPTSITRWQCMADSGNSVVITPKGYLGLCQHYSEDHFFGHINSDKMDDSVVQTFREYYDEIPECKTCPIYPDCFRLKLCADIPQECMVERGLRCHTIEKVQRQMLTTYKDFCMRKNEIKNV